MLASQFLSSQSSPDKSWCLASPVQPVQSSQSSQLLGQSVISQSVSQSVSQSISQPVRYSSVPAPARVSPSRSSPVSPTLIRFKVSVTSVLFNQSRLVSFSLGLIKPGQSVNRSVGQPVGRTVGQSSPVQLGPVCPGFVGEKFEQGNIS